MNKSALELVSETTARRKLRRIFVEGN